MSNRGFSLIQVIATTGILGIVMMFLARSIMVNSASQNAIQQMSDRFSIQQFLRAKVSCANTFIAGTSCTTAGELVELKGGDNATIATATGSGTTYGDWTIRAECSADLSGILVRIARLTASGTLDSSNPKHFKPHPLNKKQSTWSQKETLLLPNGVTFCPDSAIAREISTPNKDFPQSFICRGINYSGVIYSILFQFHAYADNGTVRYRDKGGRHINFDGNGNWVSASGLTSGASCTGKSIDDLDLNAG